MARYEPVVLETVLALVKKLSPIEKLKLVKRVLVELEPIIEAQGLGKRRSLRGLLKGQTFTDEEMGEASRKLGETADKESPKRVIQLGGLWKDVPFDVSNEDVRQVRRELSEALKGRTERL